MEEEKKLFEGQRKIGNKWAEIAKLLPGRTDNVVKNHFYSTLRRQLRKIGRMVKEIKKTDQKDISIEYLNQIMKENGIPLSVLDNENIKEYIMELEKEKHCSSSVYERIQNPAEHNYSLYLKNIA